MESGSSFLLISLRVMGQVRPELRSLFSMELPHDLRDFEPDDPQNFGIYVMAFVGEPSDPASDAVDAFEFTVCTPQWLAQAEFPDIRRLDVERDYVFGRGLLLVRRWDYDLVERAVLERCEAAKAPDWRTAFSRLSRELPWEFEYRYDEKIDRGEGPSS